MSHIPKRAYSFKEGLAMMAAKDVGIDPYLAADAGDDARTVLAALRRAKTAKGNDKAKHIATAQTELRKLKPQQHGKLISALQAKVLALQGRGADTTVAHLEPGEMVIPRRVLTPELAQLIAGEATKRGIDPRQLYVGNARASINPATGAEEFGLFGRDMSEDEKFRSTLDLPPPPKFDVEPDADQIAQRYSVLAKNAKTFGLPLSGENLDHYLSGTGENKSLPPSKMRSFREIQDAENANRDQFRHKTLTAWQPTTEAGLDAKRRMDALKDGESMTFVDNWPSDFNRDPMKTMRTGGADLYAAIGKSNLNSTADLEVARRGDLLHVNGNVNHRIKDPYDFHEGAFLADDMLALERAGKAKPYNIQSGWSEPISGTVEITTAPNGEVVRRNPRLHFGRETMERKF